MDGSFNGYLPYGQQPPPHATSQPSPSAPGSHTPLPPHHQQSHPQHSALHPYGGLTGHQSSGESGSHPTLPPLQAQNGYSPYSSMPYGHPGSQSHTPPGSHTPVSSSMTSSGGFSHQQPSMLPPSSFNSPYGMSQSMMYPSSTSTSMPQASATSGLPNLRPMPPGGVSASLNGLPSLATSGHMGQQASFMKGEEAPTHVVGSQGRRGILPSAPGRPNAPSQGSGISTKSMIPQKDADGKFPCPHCNKTYLHAKHLKRHLLRRELLFPTDACCSAHADRP
ncbi:MAG: hypothetical protein INR71_11905 [Terriglobus roseus]|nr:hypothetical protein [Terriglobus roseus]